MANRTVTIKPSGGDYTDLSSAEAGEQTSYSNLVSNAMLLTFECYSGDYSSSGGGVDYIDDSVQINGWTVSADYHIKITVADGHRHDGTVDGGGFAIKPSSGGFCIQNWEEHTEIEWLKCHATATGTGIYSYNCAAGDVKISFCLVYDASAYAFRIQYGSSHTATINRCIAVNDSDSGGTSVGFYCGNGATVNAYQCTGYMPQYAAFRGLSTFNAYGCVGFGNYAWYGTFSGDYNADNESSSYQAPGANSIHNLTPSSEIEDLTDGQQDLHLKSTSNLIDEGYNYGSPYNVDIDGTTVTGTWDIGADEYATAGGSNVLPMAINHFRRMRN